MSSTHTYVAQLIRQVRELEPLLAEHLTDNDALEPHLLMGDIARFVEEMDAKASQGSVRSRETLERLLAILEQDMTTADEATQELIAVSFLENLDRGSPRFAALSQRFGEALSAELEKQRGLYGDD